MEHIEPFCSLDSKLFFIFPCFIRIRFILKVRINTDLDNANHMHSLTIIGILAQLMQSTGGCSMYEGIITLKNVITLFLDDRKS